MRAWSPIAVCLCLATPALAQVPVAVRARARFDDVQVHARGRRITLQGVLRDDLGRPVPGAPIRAEGQRARTDASGRFTVNLTADHDGPHRLGLAFQGNPLLGPARAEAAVDVGRRAVSLAVNPVGDVPAGQPVSWTARLTDDRGGPEPDARLDWRLGDGPWIGAGTDARGRALLAHGPLAPGVHRLEVAFGGDADRHATRWARGFEATQPMGVTLTRAAGEGIRVEGRVAPGPGAVQVVITVDGQPRARRRSGPDGRWAADLGTLPPGNRQIRALAETDAPGWADAASEALQVVVPAPPPPSPAWLWLPALLGLAALAWVGWRRRPAPRRPQPRSAPLSPLTATLRPCAEPAPQDGFRVSLVDALTGQPVAGMVAGLASPPEDLHVPPPNARPVDGPIDLAPTPAWIWGQAPGHAPACLPVRAAGHFALALLPASAWVQHRFDRLLGAAGRPTLAFGVETPREAALALTGRGAPAGPVAELVAGVEAACFAPSAPIDLVHLERLAQAIEGGLQR